MTASRTSRPRARLALLAALAAGVAATVAVSGCSAGQVTQTSGQVPAVPGANVEGGPTDRLNPNGIIALRNLLVQYPGVAGYPQGGSAPLEVRIFNTGTTAVHLTGVDAGDTARAVQLVGGSPTANPVPSPSATATPSPSGTATPSGSAEPSGSAAPSSPAAPPAPEGPSTFTIEIPAGSYVLLVPGAGPFLQLQGLTRALTPGQLVSVNFAFAEGFSIPAQIPFALPTSAVPGPTGEHVEE